MICGMNFTTEVPSEVWELLRGIEEMPSGFEYSLEVIDSAMSGELIVDSSFNLSAYANKIRRNKALEKAREGERFVSIAVTSYDENLGDYNSVSYENLVDTSIEEDDFERIENSELLKYSVNKIKELSPYIWAEYRFDIIYGIRQALRGIPESIMLLRQIVSADAQIGDLVKMILGSGVSFNDLFT